MLHLHSSLRRCLLTWALVAWAPGVVPAADPSQDDVAHWIEFAGGQSTRDEAGNIVAVDLASTWATDADLARIGGLARLQKLDLAHTKITDIGLEHLKPLPNVVELSLYYAEYISDNGLAHLSGWSRLEHLNLHGTRITSRALEHLSHLTSLRSLDIGHTEVSDAGFEHLAELTRLEKLVMGGNRLSGAALPLLKLLPSLKHLDLSGIQRVDSGLWGLPLTESNLAKIGELTALEVLDLSGATLTDLGLDRPGRPDAQRAELRHLEQLSGLVNLRELDLGRTPAASANLEVLAGFPKLRRLGLGDASQVDDRAVPFLLQLSELEVLYLARTAITDEALAALQELPNLEKLFVGGSRVSAAGVERFRQARPSCRVSWWPAAPKEQATQ